MEVAPRGVRWVDDLGPHAASVLVETSTILAGAPDEASVLRDLLRYVTRDWCAWGLCYLPHADGRVLAVQGAHADSRQDDLLPRLARFPVGDRDPAHPVRRALTGGRGVLVEDLGAALSEDGQHRSLLAQLGDGPGVVAPLRARGRTLGALALATRQRATPADVALAEALGRQAGLAIEAMRLLAGEQAARHDAERAVGRLARLQRVTAALSTAATPAEVGGVVTGEMLGATGAYASAMLLADEASQTLSVVGAEGYPGPHPAAIPFATPGYAMATSRTGMPAYLETVRGGDGPAPALVTLDARAGHKSAACLPLHVDGRPAGALVLGFREPRAFPQFERDFLEALARQVSEALERARLFASEKAARLRAEAAVEASAASETRFRTLIEQFPLATEVFARDGSALIANAAWERLMRRPRQAFRGSNILADPLLRASNQRAALERAFAGELAEVPLSPLTVDGEARWVRSILFPVRDEHGAVREVVRVLEDVTTARDAEESMRESEARYRLLADHSLDIISRLAPDGTIRYISPAALRVLGYETGDAVGARVQTFLHPEDAHVLPVPLSLLLVDGDTYTRTFRRRRRDGSFVWIEMTGHAVRDARTGDVVEIVTVSRDITERRQAEEAVEASRRQVAHSEKLSALGSLVSGVAHEVRTPLAYLSNNLHLIQQRLLRAVDDPARAPALLDETLRYITDAQEGADRINTLVRDLARFVRQSPPARQEGRLHEVVGDAVRLFRATHRGRVRLDADLAATPGAPLDKAQVQQVVLNLLDNAADAAGPAGHVRVATFVDEEGATLVVEDDGPGIPPDVQVRMFDPFFTTKPDGTGLGLSIVRRIVESHQGTLVCGSAGGRGTRFTVTFPLGR